MDGCARYRSLCFKEILIIGCWTLWNHRNKIIFEGDVAFQPECMRFFKENFHLAMYKAKPSLKEGMSQWIDTL